MTPAQTAIARCDILAGCSEDAHQLTRPFASEAMRRAHEHVEEWMEEAGMTVRRDNIGNLRGRYDGTGQATLLFGSHLDSVRNAGRFDGPLGVVVAIGAVQRLAGEQKRLPFAIEVLAFADEEGLRFGSTYLGSRAVAGTFEPDDLERTDTDGVTMAGAVSAFGGDPALISADRRQPGDLLGYCEVHIEQGPVLESLDLPVGVVSAIAGQGRHIVTFKGTAGHAGTVPMDRRHDALAAAAEFVLAVEAEGRRTAGLVATVGRLEVHPGATNVIPGEVELSLDVRHADDAARSAAQKRIIAAARDISARRQVDMDARAISDNPAVPCSPRLVGLLSSAVSAAGLDAVQLPSGAGHDAVAMAHLTEVGMLFVRCKGGISHHPSESVQLEDVAVAIEVAGRFLELLARPN